MKLLKSLLTAILFLLSLKGYSQLEANHWFFGENASIDFTSGTAVHSDTSQMSTDAGVSSISDANGNLLFFTNGQTVWNKHNQVMVNGLGLEGDYNIAQGALILPQPLHDSLFYIFTIDKNGVYNYLNRLNYSMVNMNHDNGNGAVTTKNIELKTRITEHLTATRHANNKSIWLLAIENTFQNFLLYKIDPSGIISTPMLIPVIHNLSSSSHPNIITGCMKFSPDGTKLAVNVSELGTIVYDFDNATGAISNPIQLGGGVTTYGVEFSPNNRYLYVSNTSGVDQYNLLAGSSNQINASLYQVLAVSYQAKSLQLAPDGKIYIAFDNSIWLGVINTPNAARAASNYYHVIMAQNAKSKAGLPQFLTSYSFFEPPFFSFNEVCAGDSTHFTLNDPTFIDSLRWTFGDSTNGVVNSSTSFNPSHLYAQSGTYEVNLKVYSQGSNKTYTDYVTVLYKPMVRITPRDSVYCKAEESHFVRLYNHYPPNTSSGTYTWQGGSNKLYFDVNKTGWYWLEVDNGSCTTRDSIYIRFQTPPDPERLGSDVKVCGNSFEPVVLDATTPNATYLWQDGSTDAKFTATKVGTYEVEITVGGCSVKSDKAIIATPAPHFSLGEDKALCEGEALTLKTNYLNTEWNTGETGSSITITEPGTYWATVKYNKCIQTDSIQISYKKCITKNDIPNVITPNEDAANQTFYIENMEPYTWGVEIYSRWGQQVYVNPKYNNEWNAAGLKDGTYYYILKNPADGQTFKGWIEVIR